ncbi:MAG: formate dehydrogenase subunit alpha [Methylophilaceae bacterium]|nr:formate dehydrogenase subunit alpha [Gammaproteobacteria bacterium]MBL6791488.1 formate dehydrogenase subunit alpha [Methylophilaceae bacterium]MBL6899225.1 formate dehydrogenase subunit alpha [Gammaproteobacteria bacterium]
MSARPEDIDLKLDCTITLDGAEYLASTSETILDVSKRNGIEIPHLCFKEGMRPDGNCRVCVVEIVGERTLQPSCVRTVTGGMVINTNNERVIHSQKVVLELLESDISKEQYDPNSELKYWSNKLEVTESRFPSKIQNKHDLSHPAIAVNLDACIQCTRCVRACREEQVNDVIGYAKRGLSSEIIFDLDDPMGTSTCVGCGECVQACPTGALMPSREVGQVLPDKKIDSVCPYCGVGCLLTYNIKDDKILFAEGRDGPANMSRLCVKGRYGFNYVNSDQRLTVPLARKKGVNKNINPEDFNMDKIEEYFEPITWDDAIIRTTEKFKSLIQKDAKSTAGFGCAKGSNEEAYLFQKLIRTGFKNNNVDHCTRLCHASSVVALLEMIGSGAVSNQVADVAEADTIIVIGANPTVNHPVAATFIKNAAKAGKNLIVLDPRKNDLARHATHYLQFKPDTDVALLNAIMKSIIDQNLLDQKFIDERTTDFNELKEHLNDFTPEKMSSICGISADMINEVARIYASSPASIIFWGMGVSQHIHGTDNARALISLALMTGQVGRPGTGLHPLRGQNNVQGASDSGLIPMVYPDYQRVDDPKINNFFEKFWGMSLDSEPGLTVVEIMDEITKGRIKGVYVMGENPAMSDPDLNHARNALSKLEHLVVQDIFLTETAMYADIILPASAFPEKTGTFTNTDRRVQLGNQAVNPPGDAKQDLWIIQEIARGVGLDWNYKHPKEVFTEMTKCMPSIQGITWERLEESHSITYPCDDSNDPGQPVIFIDGFPTESGKAKFVKSPLINAAELPDEAYPFVLITGRQLEHWHTGSMTRRASMLHEIEPDPNANLCQEDMNKFNIKDGDLITVESRRGKIDVYARRDDMLQSGQIFIPFCYVESAANLLTNAALDPFAKIPEFKFCAVNIKSNTKH